MARAGLRVAGLIGAVCVQAGAVRAAEPTLAPAPKPEPQWPLTTRDKRPDPYRQPTTEVTAPPKQPLVPWSKQDVDLANARCRAIMANISAVVQPVEPFKDGDCGAPAAVQLAAIGKSPQVVLSPPVTVTCDVVAALHDWLIKDIQPMARKQLGAAVVKIETMSSYSCRNAYGRVKTRLSEHGRANAIDIRGFLTAAATGAEVLADWGPTRRDVIEAARAAKPSPGPDRRMQAQRPKPAETAAPEIEVTGSLPSAIPGGHGTIIDGIPGLSTTIPFRRTPPPIPSFAPDAPSRLGGPETGHSTPVAPPPASTAIDEKRQQFLREAHTSACRIFKTVLGPEANNAHRNHFHIDMAERTSPNYCE